MSDCSAGSIRHTIPAIWLLGDRTLDVVVPIERHECRQLHPAVAKLLIRVVIESACICADEGDLEDLKLEDSLNVEVHVLPLAVVVAQPVTRPFAGAGKRRTTDDERSLAGLDSLKSLVCGFLLH